MSGEGAGHAVGTHRRATRDDRAPELASACPFSFGAAGRGAIASTRRRTCWLYGCTLYTHRATGCPVLRLTESTVQVHGRFFIVSG